MKQSLKELGKYGIVGLVGLGVDWAAFFLFRDVLDLNFIISPIASLLNNMGFKDASGLDYIVPHILSSILAITNNFILNSYFTFKATDKIWQRAVSFFGIAAIGLVIGSALLPVFVYIINFVLHHFDVTLEAKVVQNLSKLVITVIIAFLQFFLNKYYTFKKKEE